MSKISNKTKKFLLNCSYLFWGLLFIGTQCTHRQTDRQTDRHKHGKDDALAVIY